MSDFICTNSCQYVIRNNHVDAIINMRSNDVVFGYKNDFAWQEWVLEKLVNDLNENGKNYKIGDIYWQVGSLHIYQRHFNFLV